MASSDHLFVLSSDASEAESLARPLRDRGWSVDTGCKDAAAACHHIEEREPFAVLISLEFDAGNACDLACALSVAASTRDVPLVFVGGEESDVATARTVAPQARFVDAAQVAWEVKQLSLRQ